MDSKDNCNYILLSNSLLSHLSSMPGYLGDKETMIVHHLANIQKECNIYDIKINQREYFTPDTIETTQQLGFKQCKYCN